MHGKLLLLFLIGRCIVCVWVYECMCEHVERSRHPTLSKQQTHQIIAVSYSNHRAVFVVFATRRCLLFALLAQNENETICRICTFTEAPVSPMCTPAVCSCLSHSLLLFFFSFHSFCARKIYSIVLSHDYHIFILNLRWERV